MVNQTSAPLATYPKTMQHVFHCLHRDMFQFCEKQLMTLWATLEELPTPRSILYSIKSGIFLGNNSFTIPGSNYPCLPPTSNPSSPHPSTASQKFCGDPKVDQNSPSISVSADPKNASSASCGNSNDASSVTTYSATVQRAVDKQTTDIEWTHFHQGQLPSQLAEAFYHQYNL